jgi:hypothetical protein
MTVAIERRMSPRMTPGALGDAVLIMQETRRWMEPAQLLDLSAGGALIRSARAIADGRRLRILVRDLPELGWIDAEAVRTAGPGEAGLRFLTPLSPEFVAAATTAGRPGRDSGAAGKTPYLGDSIPIW